MGNFFKGAFARLIAVGGVDAASFPHLLVFFASVGHPLSGEVSHA